MTMTTNGVAIKSKPSMPTKPSELRDWVLVNGSWLGRVDGDSKYGERFLHLSPVYQILGNWQIAGVPPQQQITRMRLCVPVEMAATATGVHIVAEQIVDLGTWDDMDREMFVAGIRRAEELRTALRGQRAGILLAPGQQ
jgi:hypothetical protein